MKMSHTQRTCLRKPFYNLFLGHQAVLLPCTFTNAGQVRLIADWVLENDIFSGRVIGLTCAPAIKIIAPPCTGSIGGFPVHLPADEEKKGPDYCIYFYELLKFKKFESCFLHNTHEFDELSMYV